MSRLLFDIDSIDLTQVAISPEEVGRLNPQCGDMRHLDHVVWVNDAATEIVGIKQVRDDEFWVPGHIPGRPLLPGVLQIEAAAQLCSIMQHTKSGRDDFIGFTRCDKVAFRGQVVPGDTFVLLAKETSYRPRRFVSESQGLVNGTLVFEATITGMVL